MEPTDDKATPGGDGSELSRVYFSMTAADKAKLAALAARRGYGDVATFVRVRMLEAIREVEPTR